MTSESSKRWFRSETEEDEFATRSCSPFRSKRNVHSLSLSDISEKRLRINSQSTDNTTTDISMADTDMEDSNNIRSSTPKKDPTDPSNSEIKNEIMAAIHSLGKQLSNLTLSVDEVKGQMIELHNENKQLKKEVGDLKKKNETLQEKLSEVEYKADLAYKQANQNAQYSRINNLRWYGLSEKKDKLHLDFQDMVNDKLGIDNFKSEDIEAIHRLGKFTKKQAKPRPVIVRLRRNDRDRIMMVKKKLAGSGMSLMEDLTKANLQFYNQVKNHPVVQNVWSDHGKIVICVKESGKVVKVNSMTELEENAAEWTRWVKPKPREPTPENEAAMESESDKEVD